MNRFFKTILLLGLVHICFLLVGFFVPSFGVNPSFGRVVVSIILTFVGLAGTVVTKPEQTK